MDGLLNTRTAKVGFDFKLPDPALGPQVGNRGIHYFTKDRLQKSLSQLQDFAPDGRGYDALVHSIGDVANREVLDAVRDSFKVWPATSLGFIRLFLRLAADIVLLTWS